MHRTGKNACATTCYNNRMRWPLTLLALLCLPAGGAPSQQPLAVGRISGGEFSS